MASTMVLSLSIPRKGILKQVFDYYSLIYKGYLKL